MSVPPLSDLRVIDLATGSTRYIGKLLAELGALVLCPRRSGDARHPYDWMYERAKRSLPGHEGAEDLLALAGEADLLIGGQDIFPDRAAARQFAEGYPHLIILVVSDFGLDNAFSYWKGGETIYQALGGQLSRSGIPGRKPLPAPGRIATHSGMTQAAFLALLACYEKRLSGWGQVIDFAMAEGSAQTLDPGYGMQGSATSGVPASKLPRGRPEARFLYPIIECRDGYARICVLSPRQWQGMFRWLGEPEEFADPSFNRLSSRYRSKTLIPAIADLFADKTRAQIEEESVGFGVPVAGLATLEEAIAHEHFLSRGVLIEEEAPGGKTVRYVAGPVEIDGERFDPCQEADWFARPSHPEKTAQPPEDALPLAGLRVLDLGVIVVGAEAGRLFADFGADVIKVENPSFPDGARQTTMGHIISPGFAAGHRNKRSLAIDLRSEQGREQFLELVRNSDVVLSNFKPGTMESLGLGADVLKATNPGIVMVESSAFGPTGPWSERGGYGPLVRAAAGLTYMWRYADDPSGFSDALTVYPDHAAGRISALAALALLMRRQTTHEGGRATIAQAEVMLSHVAQFILDIDLGEDSAPMSFVIPCKGDDEWCVVETETRAAREHLRAFLKLDESAAQPEIEEALQHFCEGLSPSEAAEGLQAAGIAAAPMLRVLEMEQFAYFAERAFFAPLRHPYLDQDYTMEWAPVHMSRLGQVPHRPAPLMGEQSREIAGTLLGHEGEALEQLFSAKVLFDPAEIEA